MQEQHYKRNARIRFQPHDCVVCGKRHDPVILDAEKYYRWKEDRECIQDVFPDSEMSKDQREILISGTCPECWNKLFGRCADEDLELEDTDPSEIPHTGLEADKMERERMDRINAGLEILQLREEHKWEQRDLEQCKKDVEEMDKRDEEQRQKDLEEWYESVEEQNRFFCTDPFYPSGF